MIKVTKLSALIFFCFRWRTGMNLSFKACYVAVFFWEFKNLRLKAKQRTSGELLVVNLNEHAIVERWNILNTLRRVLQTKPIFSTTTTHTFKICHFCVALLPRMFRFSSNVTSSTRFNYAFINVLFNDNFSVSLLVAITRTFKLTMIELRVLEILEILVNERRMYLSNYFQSLSDIVLKKLCQPAVPE